jgi:hypothetical protein
LSRAWFAAGAAVVAVGAACSGGLDDPAPLAPLDEAYFRCHVQPVLVKSCGQFACHGDPRRFFRVFGRNRLRYALPEEKRNSLLAPIEGAHNFDSARAYVDDHDPAASLLLLKPLDVDAGGSWHGGADEYEQGDVFSTKDDTDYQTILAWVKGAKEDAACVEPGSDQ